MDDVILMVDDDPGFRTVVKILLNRRGHDVITVHNVDAALDVLRTLRPKLFILDVLMPDGNGIEFCKVLRQRPELRCTPIIIFSANDDRRTIQRSIEAGATLFVCKSKLQSQLVQSVEQLLLTPVKQA